MPKLIKIGIESGFQTCWSALAAALDVPKPEEDQTQGLFFAFGTSLGLILETHRDPEALRRAWEVVLDVHCSKSQLLKDVCNEIITFGGSWDP